ncbi:MAG: AAA family ATPase [Methylococcales symbiont of Iophon sp. n. MRB-2018]|nr:MAG: AAA family ATPase [Methylococcales symbiont of Iophon sp. n. MRB-2018]KAF3979342.1 MAG: AAA family ATPase [Methylococcales symbiont of Iophon sp. n. MRB-2018]
MSILIKSIRIAGFRGLENIEVELEKTTVLTGMNNTGKTSFLKAIQLALGSRQFISQDDFFIRGNDTASKIIIDVLIIPTGKDGERVEAFTDGWERLFTTNRIQDDGVNSFVPLRTIVSFDKIKNSYKAEQSILKTWGDFLQNNKNWFDSDNGIKIAFNFDELPFFYMDAQRDILEDTKLRNSYLGKMLSKIEYSPKDIKELEEQISGLNEKAVSSSDILTTIKSTLKGLDSAMGTSSDGIEITPFTKKIRDLNKGLTIYYSDNQDSFSMEYHGMGTRSWSSLLTLKAFISLLTTNAKKENSVFYPILAIEEPEAHLHPNAQKKLYGQINSIAGQKIISTHSPYIAATAELKQIRSFYKDTQVRCGKIDIEKLKSEELRKINRQVINSRGEIFFSKLIVFFEGETEEQALPIFAEEYFAKTPVEMGLDFVGVGGYGNYLPFLRFAKSLNIPWLILSDAEYDVVKSVNKQLNDSGASNEGKSIVFLDNGNNFEKQLMADGYSDEIKQAIISSENYRNDQHRQAKQDEIAGYDGAELYKIITENKTQFGPAIAEQITKSAQPLPLKIVALFVKIKSILEISGD